MSEKARTAAEDRADAMDSVAGNCADCGEPARGTWGGDAFCAAHMRAALEAEDLHKPTVALGTEDSVPVPTCPDCHAEVERVGLVCPTCDALVAIGPEAASCVAAESHDGLEPIGLRSTVSPGGIRDAAIHLDDDEADWSTAETRALYNTGAVPRGRAVYMAAMVTKPCEVVRAETIHGWELSGAPKPGPRAPGEWVGVVARRRQCSAKSRGYAVIWTRRTEGK